MMYQRPVLDNYQHVLAYEAVPIEKRFNLDSNIYQAMQDCAARFAERPAMIYVADAEQPDQQQTVLYKEFISQLHQTAHFFQSLGLAGDKAVVLMLPLLPQSQVLLWAAAAAGIACPINSFLEPEHIASIINSSKAKIVVCPGPSYGDGSWQKLQSIRSQINADIRLVSIGDGAGDYQYPEAIDAFPTTPIARDIQPDDIAAYFHTGGTTGEPKLAMHSHRNHLAQLHTVDTLLANGREYSRVALGMPIFHVLGALIISQRNLVLGNTLCILTDTGFRNKAVTSNFWNLVEALRLNDVNGVPTVYSALVDLPPQGQDLSSLQRMYTGASPGSQEQCQQIKAMCGQMPLNGFGMTELCGVASCYPKQELVDGFAAGLRVPYVQVKSIEVDEDNNFIRECEAGESGLLVFSGPTVMQGYKSAQHSSNAFINNMPDGGKWLNSGDLGHMDSKGLFWISGRAKDLIIRSGHNIDPIIIEDALYHHDSVATAAAVGRPDAYTIEMPVAYVCLKPGHTASETELLEHARNTIPERAAIPASIHIIDEMPVTAVGKIFKPALLCHAIETAYAQLIEKYAATELRAMGSDYQIQAVCDKNKGTYATVKLHTIGNKNEAEVLINNALSKQPIAFSIDWQ